MKGKFTKIMAALALLVFMTPSLAGWGQTREEVVAYTLTPTNGTNNSYTGNCDIEINGITWNLTGNSQMQPWRIGGKSITDVDRPLYSKTVISDNVSKIDVTHGAASSITINSWTVIVATDDAFTNVVSTLTPTFNANSTTTISRPDGVEWSNCYYKFVYNVTVSGSSNKFLEFSEAKFYKEDGGTPTCATPTFSPAAGTYTQAQTVSISCATGGATIYYTTNGDEPTTSSSVYSTPINVSSNTTIKAMATAEGYDNSAVATAEYTIATMEHDGTLEDPYSVADAHIAIQANTGVTGVYVTGIVSQIVTAYNSQYGNITFDLVDEEGSSVTLRAYRCVGDEIAGVTVGDIAVVSGNLTLYGSTYEFEQNCQLVSLTHPQPATIILNPTSIDLGNSNAIGEQITRTITVSQLNLTSGITLSLQGNGAIDITSITMGAEPTTVTWTYTPAEVGNINAAITATSTGAETQTLTISGAAVVPVTGDCYEMVTEALQDWSGYYIITGTNSNNYYALTGVANNLGTTAAVTVIGNSIESNATTDSYRVLVAPTENGYSIYMEGFGYLYYSGSGNSLNATQTFTASTCEWTFSISNNLVTITNVNSETRMLQFNYNSGNSRFACYTSSQVKPTLFKYTGTVVVLPSISANNVSIESTATSGSITYNITNEVEGGVLSAATDDTWVTLGTVGETIPFTCSANTGAERTAIVTLTYTYNDGETVEQEVTINQAAYVAPFEPATYTLATSIESGKTYIIVNPESSKAMGAQNENNRAAADVTIQDQTITVTSDAVYEFVIESVSEGIYCIYDGRAVGFLYAASSSSNYLRTKAELDDNGKWAISFNQDGVASIVAQGGYTRNVMQYNSGSTLFSCYGSASQKPVYLYVKEEETPEPETYELTINGYTDAESKAGYYLIASPVTVNIADVDGLTEGDFDLYSYDESQELEWINYKQEDGSHPFTTLEPGKGYLYAKKATAETSTYTFTFTGTPYYGTPIVLSKQSTGTLAGWNLIGNPLATSNIAPGRAFYIMNTTIGELIASESNTVEPMQGFFVIADEDGEEFELTVPLGGDGNLDKLVMNLSQNRGTVIDRAIVRFGEGEQLPKFQLFENSTKLYIPQGNSDYAIVRSAAEGEMPVNFKAKENGTYTISVNTENVEMEYLHLIDNMTGTDVDLLATPSYTFHAKKSDYASRFKLVFSANEPDGPSTGSGSFAYYNGSEWQISNIGEATLQVVDVMGRIVKNVALEGNATVSINEMPGVYMMRLLNGNDVKVQKVVIR